MKNIEGLHQLSSASNGVSRAGADFLIGKVGEERERMAKAVEDGDVPKWVLETFDSMNEMYFEAIDKMYRDK